MVALGAIFDPQALIFALAVIAALSANAAGQGLRSGLIAPPPLSRAPSGETLDTTSLFGGK